MCNFYSLGETPLGVSLSLYRASSLGGPGGVDRGDLFWLGTVLPPGEDGLCLGTLRFGAGWVVGSVLGFGGGIGFA